MKNLTRCLVFALAIFAMAFRPGGEMHKAKQLEIGAVEEVLKKKFAMPFPKERYDIDYWNKGDLMAFEEGDEPVLVTCPVVSGTQIYLAVGAGVDAKSYRMTCEFMVSFLKNGELENFSILPSGGSDFPALKDRVYRTEGESAEHYFQRAKEHWLKWFRAKEGALTSGQLKAAYRVLDATLKQRLKSGVEPLRKDPTLEEPFQEER